MIKYVKSMRLCRVVEPERIDGTIFLSCHIFMTEIDIPTNWYSDLLHI